MFQVVTCRRTAHHFSNITSALDEMHRILSPGGKLVIDDRNVPEDDFVDKLMNDLDRYHDASHVRQYRSSEWQRMLQTSGFVIEAMNTYTQHRSISSHTEGVEDAAVEKILDMIGNLDDQQRNKLNLVQEEGQTYYNRLVHHCFRLETVKVVWHPERVRKYGMFQTFSRRHSVGSTLPLG